MQSDSSKLLTVPNLLTLLRMLLIPVFLITYYQMPEKRYVPMLVFGTASITDCLDGYIARKTNQITDFGKLCDPLADKLMQLSMLFCLGHDQLLAKWEWLNNSIIIILLLKESFMVFGAIFLLKKGTVVYSNFFGKAATVLICISVIAIFPWHGIDVLTEIGQWLLLAGVAMSLTAFVSYLIFGTRIIKDQNRSD